MAPWEILYEGRRAQQVFEPKQVEPTTLLQIHRRCSQQKTPDDHVHYTHRNGSPCNDEAARATLRGQRMKISRILYMWFVEDVSEKERLYRTCDDPFCVNPHHYSRERAQSHAAKLRRLNDGERHDLYISPEHRHLPFDKCLLE